MKIPIPGPFKELLKPHRYKIFHGGRGGAKSWSVARALLLMAMQSRKRIICAREFQNSIRESVHALLDEQIRMLSLGDLFTVQERTILGPHGSEFVFMGLKTNIHSAKSFEGADVIWIEEGQTTSKESLDVILPTIRKEGSEIWITLNLNEESDPVNTRFIVNPPPGAYVRKINFDENRHMSSTLEAERQEALRLIETAPTDEARAQAQADYDHVWLGFPRRMASAGVIKRWVVEAFETPPSMHFYHGADWGFADDPTAITRSFVQGDSLYIDAEAGGHGIELDDLPALFDKIPTARTWPIIGDSSRPETISHMRSRGFRVVPSEKWSGSVEDGIALLNSFKRIVIHPRCVKTAEEARLYRYKVDRMTQEILPIIVDKHNHYFDSVRYAIGILIKQRSGSKKTNIPFMGR